MRFKVSEFAGSRADLNAGEAVALVLAAAQESVEAPGDLAPADAVERVKTLATMLHTLLRLDEPSAANRPRVPGALLVLISRATGQMDLPPPRSKPSRMNCVDSLRRHGQPSMT
jgi:hypothetical protein